MRAIDSLLTAGFSQSSAAEVRDIISTMERDERERAVLFLLNATKDPTIDGMAKAAAVLAEMEDDEKARLRRLALLLCDEEGSQ